MTTDVGQIAAWITALGVILSAVIAAYKLIDKHLVKRFRELDGRVAGLESWTGKQQQDIFDGAERDRIIVEGLLACLKGLQEQGVNGPVTEGIRSINAYLSAKAHKTMSR